MDSSLKTNSHYLYFISIVSAMGGLLFGFDIAVISGSVPFIQPYFNLSELELGWGVSSLLIGCTIGAFFTGLLADAYGRKKVLIVVALLFAVSCLATGVAPVFTVFVLARIFAGLAVGAASVLCPMYIAEVSPPQKRGKLVAGYQLAIVMGILLTYFINYLLHDIGENNWRWMFIAGVFPSLVFFFMVFFIPESPRWLYKVGRKDESEAVLLRLLPLDETKRELAQIAESFEGNMQHVNMRNLLNPGLRKVMRVSFWLAVFIQFTGINTVIDYSTKIFEKVGFNIENALFATWLIGFINFAFTLLAIRLIDRVGRKPLYLTGSLGMVVTMLLISASFYFEMSGYVVLICILAFIAFFATCIGPVFWTLVSEIFPNKVRGTAVAFASLIHWLSNFVVIYLFPWFFANVGGALTFGFLAFMSLIQWWITLKYVPETKGKTLEEIEQHWKKH